MGKLNIADEFIKGDNAKERHSEKGATKTTTITISDKAYKLLQLNKLYNDEHMQDCIDRVIIKELEGKFKIEDK
ncbi:MAG: hypothetical protein PF545_03290 [Elusimicrobia bacterium]|jgi:hypothetical protein|nr:hypothetical protein [Elusimicrobiota bacterium]